MENKEKLAKIYDEDNNYLGSGSLLSINNGLIKVKGNDLPILKGKTTIKIELYDELRGILPHLCEVSVAARNQLNATIINREPVVERRRSLKMRTDLSFYVNNLYRDDEDITESTPNMKINLLNLSIGGMLISTNYDLMVNDMIIFDFQYESSQIVQLKAKVIRIDKIYDNITKEFSTFNYGCQFEKLASYDEAVITKYLFDRQLQLYKNR